MAARLFALLALVFLLLTSREPPWADSHVVYDTTQALVERGELNVQLPGDPWFFAHHNGKKYGVFPLGNVIAMIPSYLAFRGLRATHLFPEQPLFNLASHLSPALLMAGACTLFFRLLRGRGAPPGAAAGLTLALGLGTICFSYARVAYSEALQTLSLLWVVALSLRQGRAMTAPGMLLLGVAAGVLFNTKLVYAPVLLVCAGYVLYGQLRGGVRPGQIALGCALGAVGFAPFLGLALWHNWLKTGSLFDSGYQIRDGIFSGDLWPALYGFTLSTGKSAFLYSPVLILGALGARRALREDPQSSGFLLAVIAAVTVLNAKFRHWHADYCWGPRHLTVINPLLLLLSWPWLGEALKRGRRELRRAALGGLLGLSLLAQLLGASIYWDHYIRVLIAMKDQTGAAGWFHEQLTHGHYIPQFSPLRGQLWLLSHYLRRDPDLGADAPWRMLVPAPVDLRGNYAALRIDWWGLDWLVPGAPGYPRGRAPGAILLLLLGGGVAAASLGLRRRLSGAGRIAGPGPPC